ncbi:ubiquinone anaerobic biosynthesis accessory factor UbiT [Photobacterium salinisoli]|uniref:ubiquinone anaerobic biosynthesis accessory factor UbiT n=1 Tax=Photobacterium salinisoli TaxID=1616783 RepID=UPI0013C4D30E|nr:SCP2 sterol-binding domain-containing protein [Photobacterium salinisoli]
MHLQILPGLPELAPQLLKYHCRLTPFFVHKGLIEQALAVVFKEALSDGELDFLADRTVTITIVDLDWAFTLTLNSERLVVLPSVPAPNAVMKASSQDLLRIAARKVDPDTLFFQRRLMMTGDTELGLAVKNLLDSLEPDRWPKSLHWLLTKAAVLYGTT